MTLSMVVTLSSLVLAGQPKGSDSSVAFERLRALQGSWKGTYLWSGARNDSGAMDATYRVSGAGSAVIEDLMVDGKPSMTTVYHLDGTDLRMTHYCAAKNQPRLKAASIDLTANVYRFDFVDITNLATPDAPHVHGFTMHLVDPDHLQLEFAFTAKGKESLEHITLTRG
jgi:hypothetical protein